MDKRQRQRYERSRSRSQKKTSKKEHKKQRRLSRSTSKDSLKKQISHFSKDNLSEEEPYYPAVAESKCLVIEDLSTNISQQLIEEKFKDICQDSKTYPPEEIKYVSALSTAYITFPSPDPAKKVLMFLKGRIVLNGKSFPIEFYPMNLLQTKREDVNLVQDWLCEKCSFHNFARRQKCHKCDHLRTKNSKMVYSGASVMRHFPEQNYANANRNTSLMIRGNIITKCNQTMVLEVFSQLAAIKDIRMTPEHSQQNKDCVFIEFYTAEEAEMVLRACQTSDFLMYGERIHATFSRQRGVGQEEYLNENNDGQTLYPYDSGYQQQQAQVQPQYLSSLPFQQLMNQNNQTVMPAYYQQQIDPYQNFYQNQRINPTQHFLQMQHSQQNNTQNYQQLLQQNYLQKQQETQNFGLKPSLKQQELPKQNVGLKPSMKQQELPPQTIGLKPSMKQQELPPQNIGLKPSMKQQELPQQKQPIQQKIVQNTVSQPNNNQQKENTSVQNVFRNEDSESETSEDRELALQQKKAEEQKNSRKLAENQLKKWEKEQSSIKKGDTLINKEEQKKSNLATQEKTKQPVPMPQKLESEEPKDIKHFCLLCKRKFKYEATLIKHHQISEMHRVNLLLQNLLLSS